MASVAAASTASICESSDGEKKPSTLSTIGLPGPSERATNGRESIAGCAIVGIHSAMQATAAVKDRGWDIEILESCSQESIK